MTRNDDIVDELYNHCIAKNNPSSVILENGRFPVGWFDKYLKLLEEANQLWQPESCWPKKLVAAIHFTSFYLEIRYKAWCKFHGDRNTQTEDFLAKIRVRSEFFLLNTLMEDTKERSL